ncbi:hypothetical protein BHM03_00011525 [Ensete ventricosum]|nr:hypothetical protein BHM03_00011525 [Ensete ventricosum]
MVRVTRELDCFSAHILLREAGKSDDKVECKAMDSRVMSLAAPWYHRGRTSMESSKVLQRWIYRSRSKGRICKAMDSMTMGLAAPLYRRD